MPKFAWGIVALVIVGALFGVYGYLQGQKLEQGTGMVYNPFSQQWEPTAKTPTNDAERTTILEHAVAENNATYNPTILRGFFEFYDPEKQQLGMKAVIAFTQNNLYEQRLLALNPSQNIYCVPEVYIDPNTGINYPIEKLMVPVQPEKTLFLPDEQTISLDHFLSQSTDRTYLLVQLTSAFSPNTTNYIQKLIAIGLCE